VSRKTAVQAVSFLEMENGNSMLRKVDLEIIAPSVSRPPDPSKYVLDYTNNPRRRSSLLRSDFYVIYWNVVESVVWKRD
jgi:hypothetical protein